MAERASKEEAQWYCDVLETAFKTLITPKNIDKLKSESVKKKFMNSLLPKITITNLR